MMSESKPSAVPVAILLIGFDTDSTSAVTLRVKPDRRRNHVPVPATLERRIAIPAARLAESQRVVRGSE